MPRCPECDFELLDLVVSGHGDPLYNCVYNESKWADAAVQILDAVDGLADAILSLPVADVRQKSNDDWSAIEYGCHVRDVLIYQRERVLRSLRGFGHEALPMGRNERAEHDGYRDQDPLMWPSRSARQRSCS